MISICLVEDDDIMGESLVDRFELEGYDVCWCKTAGAAYTEIMNREFAVVISDISLPDFSGDELLSRLSSAMPAVPPIIYITGYGTIDQAVSLLRKGAADYLTKPLDIGSLLKKLASLTLFPVRNSHENTPQLGISRAMRDVVATLERLVAHPDVALLITGESGVGKEVAARLLHTLQCPQAPFESVNCAALPESLIASELFGHVAGAFTGAQKQHHGVFERAAQGILLLDEIGDMPLDLQTQLLRVLQERQFHPLGSERPRNLQARVICATHQNLHTLVAEHKFREDLYYRINVIELEIPPLRERPEDVLWLADKFLSDYAGAHQAHPGYLNEAAKASLVQYPWPGNARELKHAIERASILSDSAELSPDSFAFLALPSATSGNVSLRQSQQQDEQQKIVSALRQCDGKIQLTAEMLGISRKSLWEKRKKYGL